MKTSLFKSKTATLLGLSASLVSLGVCATIALANPQVVFSDSNFSSNHYTTTSTDFGNGGAGNASFGTGNVTISSTVTPGNSSYSAHYDWVLCKWAKYTPSSQGAINRISWKQTVNCTQAQGQAGVVLFIFQGGKYFRSLVGVNPGTSIVSRINLTSNDFVEIVSGMPSLSAPQGIKLGSYPDFTASGSVMQFGIASAKAAGPGVKGSKASGVIIVDDWEVKVVPM